MILSQSYHKKPQKTSPPPEARADFDKMSPAWYN